MFQKKEKGMLLMQIISVTTQNSRHKQSLQIYNKHKEYFGITQIDLKVQELIRIQKQEES